MIADKPFWLLAWYDDWWGRQDWIGSPFSWMPFLAISLVLLPLSLLLYMITTLVSNAKEETNNASKQR